MAEAGAYVRGEVAELVPDDEVPARYGDGVPDEPEPQTAPESALLGPDEEPEPVDDPPEDPAGRPRRSSSRRRPLMAPA